MAEGLDQHARGPLVSAGQVCAIAGLALLGLAVTGVVLLIFTVTAGRPAGVIAATITFVVFTGLWSAPAPAPAPQHRH